jgi:hypothetical protein
MKVKLGSRVVVQLAKTSDIKKNAKGALELLA